VIVIAHGIGEHGGCYDELARELVQPPLELEVVAVDFTGHGERPGPRGYVPRYRVLVEELAAAVAWARGTHPGCPGYVLGHSNGGQVALWLALERPELVDGLVLSNPSLRLAHRPPAWKLLLGRVLHRVAPRITLPTGLDDAQMTSDTASLARRRSDRLRHDRISAELYFGMLEGGEALLARAAEVHTPTLMLLGEADPVIDAAASGRFAEALGTAERSIRRYPGMRHEPLNEVGREQVVADLARWLAARLDGSAKERLTAG
jgi:alpha-beta hydrolase superfamily lysophospholipase